MSILNLLAIALALAMDAFAVAIAVGMELKKVNFRQTFRLSWHFGFFQAAMPVIGWILGMKVRSAIERYDHWAAFVLLAFVGGKMLKEAFEPKTTDPDQVLQKRDPTRGASLVVLSVATSIDALAIGISLSMIHVSIVFPAVVIGVIASTITIIGLHAGSRLGAVSRFSALAEILGGLILLAIGFKILIEHGVFS